MEKFTILPYLVLYLKKNEIYLSINTSMSSGKELCPFCNEYITVLTSDGYRMWESHVMSACFADSDGIFTCPLKRGDYPCQNKFSNKYNLISHLKSHQKKGYFKCMYCPDTDSDQAWKNRSDLKKHLKKFHGIDMVMKEYHLSIDRYQCKMSPLSGSDSLPAPGGLERRKRRVNPPPPSVPAPILQSAPQPVPAPISLILPSISRLNLADPLVLVSPPPTDIVRVHTSSKKSTVLDPILNPIMTTVDDSIPASRTNLQILSRMQMQMKQMQMQMKQMQMQMNLMQMQMDEMQSQMDVIRKNIE
jgi:hypothetical protein